MHTKILELLKMAVANRASDVHLSANAAPKLRVNSELIDVNGWDEIKGKEAEAVIMSILTEEQKGVIEKERELDFSLVSDEARFRVNMYFQRGIVACSLRTIVAEIPNFEELTLPEIMSAFVRMKQGFVLITGPTGQGKSTTVASVLNEINISRSCHIVTIEDPIEYVIQPKRAIISQREVGSDTNSFAKALRSVLRQDPNIVFVGEMRDLETISSALTVAETGHLVFSTLHTNSASQTVDRIIDVFPEGAKGQIRTQLAEVITAVVSQRLLPKIGGGMIPAFEILVATPAVKNIIREGKTFMIDNVIQTSADTGMISLETSLAKLVLGGKITEEVALNSCLRPGELENRLRDGNRV